MRAKHVERVGERVYADNIDPKWGKNQTPHLGMKIFNRGVTEKQAFFKKSLKEPEVGF